MKDLDRKIRRHNVASRLGTHGRLLECLDYATQHITHLTEAIGLVGSGTDDFMKSILKGTYITGYRAYLRCLKIQQEYSEFFQQDLVDKVGEVKKNLDLSYKGAIRELRRVQYA